MSELDDVTKEFLIESYENLDRLDRELVCLEEVPDDPATLAGIFRTFHTIKGTAGFLGYGRLQALTHVGENLLSRLRDGEIALTGDITSALLAMGDAVREMLGNLENVGDEGTEEYAPLKLRLVELQEGGTGDVSAPPPPAPRSTPPPVPGIPPRRTFR